MRKILITLSICTVLFSTLSAQKGKIYTEKEVQQIIDVFCDLKKSMLNDPKYKAVKPEKIESRELPSVFTEAEMERSVTLFNKSLSVSKSPFRSKDNELSLRFDDYHVLNPQLTKLTFNAQKLVTTKLKETPIRADVAIDPTQPFILFPVNTVLKDTVQRIEGEMTMTYYAQFKTYSFSKADIGKPRNINGINVTLKTLENGFYQYTTDKKGDSTWRSYPFSKNNEWLASDNFSLSTSRFLDSLLQNAKYVDKKGWVVTDAVTKQMLQLVNTPNANDKIYDKGTLNSASAWGTIDHVVFYVPFDLRTKKYKLAIYSESSRPQERYENRRFVRQFVTLDEAQIKAQFKPTLTPEDEFSSEKSPKKKLSFDIPTNENMKLATIKILSTRGLRNGKWETIAESELGYAYQTNLSKGYYKTYNLKVDNFEALQGEVRIKFPVSFVETTKKRSDFFDKVAFDKKQEDDEKAEEAKTVEQREKEEREREKLEDAKTDEQREKEYKEKEQPKVEPIYPFILTSKNSISVLDNTKGDTQHKTYLIVRAFDKNGLELKVNGGGSSFQSDVAMHRGYEFYGEIDSIKLYEVSKWVTMTLPFNVK
jgi:hypothetical protein